MNTKIDGRFEIVEWPPWPYGVVALGTPCFSVFDRLNDRHVHWTKDKANAIEWAQRQASDPHYTGGRRNAYCSNQMMR